MLDNLANYLAPTGFMPHGYCFLWAPTLLWIDVASDLVIATSYFSIPFALWYFVKKRPDVPFPLIFLMFGVFVLACGTTHLFAVWNIWHADYWPEAVAKALTASASAATALLLWPLIPKALTIPSHVQLEDANQKLQDEVLRRQQAEHALLGTNEALERRVAERTAELDRLTRLYAALSQCNQAIVRCASEEELFRQICLAAVEFGGATMAWIGLLDKVSNRVEPVAAYGEGIEYLEGVQISTDAGSAFGHGLVGTAMRGNQPLWCQDYLNDPMTAPWHERAVRAGWRSMATLPLNRNGVVVGVLALLSAEVNPFDIAARNLLVEMATDISFALDNFARAAARVRVEQELRAAEEKFRGLVEQAIAGIYIIQDGMLIYVNPRCAEIVDQGTTDELIGTDPLSWVAEADRGKVAESMRRLLGDEAQNIALEFGVLRRDGVVIEVGANAARAAHEGRPAIIGMLQDISEKKRAEERIQRYLEQLEAAFMSTVEVATALSEMRDPYTAGHERRVGRIAAAIGAELGFDSRRIEGLRVAGFLHDIGKITIPAEILSKPGKLSHIEFELIKGHPQSSYDVLKGVEFPWPVAEVALQHHERMDGSGYPHGLKGEAILLEARIMAVADVMEAMSSHRPYRPGLGIEAALAEIERGRGSVYDPVVADACIKLFREKGDALIA